MLLQIVELLLGTLANLLAVAFLARLYAQRVRAPFRSPTGQFIAALTDWAVLPLRRIIPGLFGLDMASLFAAWLTQIVHIGVMAGLSGALLEATPEAALLVAWIATLSLLRMFIYLLMGVVIIVALLSWLNPYSPLAPFFDLLARPLLNPVRRRMPTLGGADLSPMVVLIALEIALMVLERMMSLRFWLS